MDKKYLAQLIDHTLLKPEATPSDIIRLCEEARYYQFCCVCVNPYYVPLARKLLEGSNVKVCSVVGFPLGAISGKLKVLEAQEVVREGAKEVDVVINIGSLKAGDLPVIENELSMVVEAVKEFSDRVLVKAILETCYLTESEKVAACKLAMAGGADFVKTSTGFGPKGASTIDVRLLRSMVGPKMGVKASGGIRDFFTLKAMTEAGADRIGTSSGVYIMEQAGF